MKYFGFKTKQEFIDEIKETELWIYYKQAAYVFTFDARGWNCMIDEAYDKSLEIDGDTTFSSDTVEGLIEKVILYDGVPLIEALEMDTKVLS